MRQKVQQLPLESRQGHDAIFEASYLEDIPSTLAEWNATRVLLVVSKTLDTTTNFIKNLESRLGGLSLSTKKVGVGSHSPYRDIVDIAHRVQNNDIHAVVSIGSGSYSDACKIAVMLSATLPRGFDAEDMEALVDQTKGLAGPENIKAPTTKLICVPTSLSAGEWNSYASGTNSKGKKQHFVHSAGAPSLILCDPHVAATTPRDLWLASGVRAIDHCVEGLCSPKCHAEAAAHLEKGLRCLLKGLSEYRAGCEDAEQAELLRGISECQLGSREALLPWIKWKVSFGASHAIGHQLVSCGPEYL
jgi:alcohol dehydrogenase class IV